MVSSSQNFMNDLSGSLADGSLCGMDWDEALEFREDTSEEAQDLMLQ